MLREIVKLADLGQPQSRFFPRLGNNWQQFYKESDGIVLSSLQTAKDIIYYILCKIQDNYKIILYTNKSQRVILTECQTISICWLGAWCHFSTYQ